MSAVNQQILLASRPTGAVEPQHFRLVEGPLPVPGPGQVLVRNQWLSLDPYMRGRMSDAKSYARPVELGAVMIGGTAGVVVESRHPDFSPGDTVIGSLGWQLWGVADAGSLTRVDATAIPLRAYLGAAGMPGITAWLGLRDICQPRAGETLVVTAASGAVGSVVGQLARLEGCRVVGVAGGAAKCRYLVDELGFDAAVDYKRGDGAADFRADLRAALPDGIDALFENVGGPLFDALLARLKPFSRVALCGLISDYESRDPYRVANLRSLLVNRVRLQGFIASDHLARWPEARAELAAHVAAGRLRYRESIASGLAAAPEALIGLLHGRNFGKQLVELT